MRQNKIDIVHSHGYKSNFYAIFSTLFTKVSLLCSCHPWLETEKNRKARFYTWLDKSLLLNRFDRIVAISEDVRNEIIASNVPKHKIALIPNGIDTKRFSNSYDRKALLAKFNVKQGRKIIGTIGRLSKEKAQDVFIAAADSVRKIFPESYFIIVGEGPLTEELNEKVRTLNLQNHVRFTGVLDNIPEILSLLDIFVLPSLSEGLPMVILEAMAARKPVIATNVGAIPSVIIDGETGVLVDPKNIRQLAKAMVELLSNHRKCHYIMKNAYSKVVREFSSTSMSKSYMKIYEQLPV